MRGDGVDSEHKPPEAPPTLERGGDRLSTGHVYGLLQSAKRLLIIATQSFQQKLAARAASRKARQQAREVAKVRSLLLIDFWPSEQTDNAHSKVADNVGRPAEGPDGTGEVQARIRADQERQEAETEQARLQAVEERRFTEARARIKVEQERQQAEAEQERLRAEEEEGRLAEARARTKAEQERQQAETEQARLQAVEERRLAEARARIKVEQERQQAEAEQARLQAVEERRLAEARARTKAEQERQQAETEQARLQAVEERRLAEARARIRAEQERQQAEAEQARLQAEEETLKDSETKHCPKCNRVFGKDRDYCLYDATWLVSPADARLSPASRPDATTWPMVWMLVIIAFLGAGIVGVLFIDYLPKLGPTTSKEMNKSASVEQDQPVVGGALNGKETILPNPEYPERAKREGVSGKVTVAVLVDRKGTVRSARALDGHPLLQEPALAAARKARFAPEKLIDQRARTSGTITYNFKL